MRSGSPVAATGAKPTCTTPSARRGGRAGSLSPTALRSSKPPRRSRSIPARLEPLTASSRGFGELVAAALAGGAKGLVLGLGGTATMDAGAGFLEVVSELPVPALVACDVTATLDEAPRVFGPQKGAGPDEIAELERRFAAEEGLRPLSRRSRSPAPQAGSARRWRRSARSSSPARRTCSTRSASTPRRSTSSSPARVASTRRRRSARRRARSCAAPAQRAASSSAAIVEQDVPGAETVALSGDPSRARDDLVALGRELANRG